MNNECFRSYRLELLFLRNMDDFCRHHEFSIFELKNFLHKLFFQIRYAVKEEAAARVMLIIISQI